MDSWTLTVFKGLQLMINDDSYNCSDDGGETYQLSSSTFSRADESSLAFVGEEKLVVNLRRDVKVIMMVALIPRIRSCPQRVGQ